MRGIAARAGWRFNPPQLVNSRKKGLHPSIPCERLLEVVYSLPPAALSMSKYSLPPDHSVDKGRKTLTRD